MVLTPSTVVKRCEGKEKRRLNNLPGVKLILNYINNKCVKVLQENKNLCDFAICHYKSVIIAM